MRIITDKKDRFGNFPIWFNSHNLRDINDYLQSRYDGFKFAIIIDASKGECGPLEKPLPVYFMGDIAEEVAQEAYKKLIDKSEYDKLMELKNEHQHGYNATNMNPVDEFICSVCGFGCIDYLEIGLDNDSDDIQWYRGCEFYYCPHCGAKIDKSAKRNDGGKE